MKVFSLLFGAIYYACVWQVDWTLFYYYPETNRFYWTAHPDDGAAILWYGWLSTAAVVSVPLALLVPDRVAARLPDDLSWMVGVAVILTIFVHESRWFL